LGEQLAGKIERNRTRPIALDDAAKTVRHLRQRRVPVGARECAILRSQHWVEEPRTEPERLAERRAFRAELSEVRRMLAVTRNRGAALSIRRRKHAATHAAVRAGGANGG